MRGSILRAGVVVALLVLTGNACASPSPGAVARDPEAMRGTDATHHRADSAPAWMTEALLGAFRNAAGAPPPAPAAHVERMSTRPHQDPAYPAAFVFQSHSSLFLAANTNAHSAAHRGTAAV